MYETRYVIDATEDFFIPPNIRPILSIICIAALWLSALLFNGPSLLHENPTTSDSEVNCLLGFVCALCVFKKNYFCFFVWMMM